MANRSSSETTTYVQKDWHNGHWGIQAWLERTAWCALRNTSYGRSAEEEDEPHPALFEDPFLKQVFLMDIGRGVVVVPRERVA